MNIQLDINETEYRQRFRTKWTKERLDEAYAKGDPWHWIGSYREIIRNKLIVDIVKQSDCSSCLDIGCGPGTLTCEVAQYISGQVLAFDLSETVIETAKRQSHRDNIHYFQYDVNNFNSNMGTFDLVMSAEVIYYLEVDQVVRLFREIHNSLNKGGFFILGCDILGRYFAYEDIIKMLKEGDFRIVRAFSLYPRRTYTQKIFYRLSEMLHTDNLCKAIVSNLSPETAQQFAFVCIPK